MLAKRGHINSFFQRAVMLSGEKGLDFDFDLKTGSLRLLTSDKEQLTKGSTQKVNLITKLSIASSFDRVMYVKLHPDLLGAGPTSAPAMIDVDDGEDYTVSFWITPKVDVNINKLPYIVKLFVEN